MCVLVLLKAHNSGEVVPCLSIPFKAPALLGTMTYRTTTYIETLSSIRHPPFLKASTAPSKAFPAPFQNFKTPSEALSTLTLPLFAFQAFQAASNSLSAIYEAL